MNNKGEMGSVGLIIIVAVTIIVGIVLFQVIAQQVGSTTNTVSVANDSLGDALNTSVYLTSYKSLTDVVVYNESGDAIVPGTEYTVTNNVVYNGALAVLVEVATDPAGDYYGHEWTISGTGQETTYIAENGGRAAANLIVIFFALAVLAVAMYPLYKGELGKLIGM